MTHTEGYIQFLEGEEWKQIKREVVERRGLQCEKCGVPLTAWQVRGHHLGYDKEFGTEDDGDVMVLCQECHDECEQDLEFFGGG